MLRSLSQLEPDDLVSSRFRTGSLVKATTSLCPDCLANVAAEVYERAGEIWMDKECPDHGPFSALLASELPATTIVLIPNISTPGKLLRAGPALRGSGGES